MGAINFNRGDVVYVDAQVAIYSVEGHPTFSTLCDQIWRALAAGDITVSTSELTLLGCLILPLRDKDLALVSRSEAFFAQPAIWKAPVSLDVFRSAAGFRAEHQRLKTPDAIQIATATLGICNILVTNDRDSVGCTHIPTVVLADLVP